MWVWHNNSITSKSYWGVENLSSSISLSCEILIGMSYYLYSVNIINIWETKLRHLSTTRRPHFKICLFFLLFISNAYCSGALAFGIIFYRPNRRPHQSSPLRHLDIVPIIGPSQRAFSCAQTLTWTHWKSVLPCLLGCCKSTEKMVIVRLNGIQLPITQLLPNTFQCNLPYRVRKSFLHHNIEANFLFKRQN